MKKIYLKTGILSGIAALLCGCSSYNAALKSGKPDIMFGKALEYYNADRFTKAIPLLEETMRYTPGSNRADSVIFYLASSYFKTQDYESSSLLLDQFRQMYTNSIFLEQAEYMYAEGYYLLSPPANRDQSHTMRALVAIDEYVERYPQSSFREEMLDNMRQLNLKLEYKSYINAKSYYKTEMYKSAIIALQNTLAKYPNTKYREELLYLTAKSSYLLANRSVESLQRERYLDMMDSYYNFAGEFPESGYKKELDKMMEEATAYIDKFKDADQPASTTQENNNTDISNGN